MATREQYQLSTEERRRRKFSEDFKRKKVREIEQKICTISEISRQYQVRKNSIYLWLMKYGKEKKKGERIIVEAESDTRKLIELKARVAELERIIGQKQIEIDFKNKMIELAEEAYQIDIKKKFSSKLLSGTGNTGNSSQQV